MRAALYTLCLIRVTGGYAAGGQVVSVGMPEAGVYGFSFILSFIHQTLSTIFHVPETVTELDHKIINKT